MIYFFKIKKTASYLFIIVFMTAVVFSAAQGVLADTSCGNGGILLTTLTLREILINAINYLVSIVAVVAILIIIIGGLLWMTAGGDQERLASARKWVLNAVIGLVVALGCWAIVYAIVHNIFPAK